jgi:uncharacterized membrane protein YeaQ/YmgE (transglycosylase-associated protein family)
VIAQNAPDPAREIPDDDRKHEDQYQGKRHFHVHLSVEKFQDNMRLNDFPNRRISNIIAGMSYLAWVILGLFAGFIGSTLVNKSGQGLIMDIVLGIVGAVVGGWLAGFFGLAGFSELNFYSIGIAVGGALLVLLVYHGIRRAV